MKTLKTYYCHSLIYKKGNMTSALQITIDGPAASGKSTIAQEIARQLNATYINTGEMYRCLTQWCMSQGIEAEDTAAIINCLDKVDVSYRDINGQSMLTCCGEPVDRSAIRRPEITAKVSIVAKIPEVRQWMVERQRDSANTVGLLVMEGRDIGTVVFPQAKWKFFLTASPEERARRRLAQDGEIPDGATLDSVAKAIAERDEMDRNRKVSPLVAADDAIKVDTTGLAIEDVMKNIISHIDYQS